MAEPSDRIVVLLADDNEDDVALIRRSCATHSTQTELVSVCNGEQAIEYLLGGGRYGQREIYPSPHMVVLDHRMPRLSGLGVLCWMRDHSRFAEVPVLILSHALTAAEVEAVSRLRAASVSKPMAGCESWPVIESGLAAARTALGRPYRSLAFRETRRFKIKLRSRGLDAEHTRPVTLFRSNLELP